MLWDQVLVVHIPIWLVMLLSPYSFFTISQIYDYVFKYSYDNETKESTIELSDYNFKE